MFRQISSLLSALHVLCLKATVTQSYFIVFVWRGNTLTCLGCHATSQLSESASAREVGPQHTFLTHQRRAKVTPYAEPPRRGIQIFNAVSRAVLLSWHKQNIVMEIYNTRKYLIYQSEKLFIDTLKWLLDVGFTCRETERATQMVVFCSNVAQLVLHPRPERWVEELPGF